MAVTIDEILTRGKGPALTAGIPSIDSSLQGAPDTMPGSGTSDVNTEIKGAPVQSASVPATVAPDVKGAPNAGQTVDARPEPITIQPPATQTPSKDNGSSETQKDNRLEIIPPELPNASNLPKIGEKINTGPREETDKNGEPKRLSYVELFQQLSPYKPPTPEELEKERKRQKREAIFSAIGEGISALSNLYFTSQYAPNAFDPSKGMAATTKKRFDQLKKEREANQREYMAGYMRAMQMDADAARDERNWSHTIEREKITDKWRQDDENRKRDKDEFDAQKRQLDLQYLQGKIDRQDYLNQQEELETEYMKKHNQKMPTTPKPSSGRSGGASSGGKGGGGKKTSLWKAYNPKTGETITIYATDAANAWSQVPDGFTIRQAPSTTTTESTSGNGRRTKTTRRTSTRNANDNLEGPGKKRRKNKLGL